MVALDRPEATSQGKWLMLAPPSGPKIPTEGVPDGIHVQARTGGRSTRRSAYVTAVPTWQPGDTIPLDRERNLRVIDTRAASEPDKDPVLVVSRPSHRPMAASPRSGGVLAFNGGIATLAVDG
jgi:hypothetical protein